MKWFTQKARKEKRDPRQEAAPANRATSALNGHVLPATEDESWLSLRNTLVTGLALDAPWCLHGEKDLLWWSGPSPTLIRVHERYKLADGIPRDTIEVVTTVAEFAGDPPSPDEQAAVFTALNVWNRDTPW